MLLENSLGNDGIQVWIMNYLPEVRVRDIMCKVYQIDYKKDHLCLDMLFLRQNVFTFNGKVIEILLLEGGANQETNGCLVYCWPYGNSLVHINGL
jgi:hypothetical protein